MALAFSTKLPTVAPASKRIVRARAAVEPGEQFARTLPGITGPQGYFDPLGLAAKTTTEEVKRYRESELTHGRVCMLAAVGFVVGENLEGYPLLLNIDGNITGPAIYQFQQVGQGFWEPLVLAIGVAETYRAQVGWKFPTGEGFNKLREDYEPGNLGFDPLGLRPQDPAAYADLKARELNNGRLAMIAVAGFTAQELVDGKGIFEGLILK